jgi:putative Ca2+/H+ antiporter (TMEM165/GDT1 family)
MYDVLAATVAAFGIVFLAELGDKTQLLAVNFGSRYSLGQVIAGLALGYGQPASSLSPSGACSARAFPSVPSRSWAA